jgi:DNA gyrase subunit A
MEIGTVRQVYIEQEMQQAYLDYAMSVIVSRALPDVRDGLKPVQRRILYAMHDMGLKPDKPYKKSARIVGEVLGKYHPHGDAAVYDAMVRMAQDFSMRAMLVDGQGNFGSIDGDGAAAMRYTEARIHVITQEILADIDKETVDFVSNFDGTLTEPSVLPSALPNLLVNGASGIAVGMATNIPPHNLGEICDALTYLLDRWNKIEDVTTEELLQFVQGPDFPTGGVVYRYAEDKGGGERVDALESAYAVGKGRFTVQAKAHMEEMTRGRNRIIVTELPYQVNKAHLVERIAELARDGRIEGISDLRDESDRQGLRVVIELTRTADPREVLSALFKLTPMQMTFGMTLLALVDGEPRMLSLKKALQLFLEHRRDIVTRRSRYDLEKAKLRAHILEGLRVALDNLDEVIAIIRRSQTTETAHANLRKRFKLTDIQAQAILDMQLRRLAALERKKIEEEYAEKKKLIAYLEDLLAHPKKISGVIRSELADLKARYADPRRTQIIQREKRDLTTRELVAEQDVIVVASASGKLRTFPVSAAAALPKELGDETPIAIVQGNTRDDLLVCTDDGQAYTLPMHRLPVDDRAAWNSLADLCTLSKTGGIVSIACLAAGEDGAWPGFIVLATRQGKVKRLAADDLKGLRGSGTVIGLDEGDRVMSACPTTGDQQVVICSAQGQGIRFGEEEVRPMGLPAGGVMSMKLAANDFIVGALPALPEGELALVSRLGYGKRVALSGFPTQKRYGGGVVVCKVAAKSGPVASAALVSGGDTLLVCSTANRIIGLPASELPVMGRATTGKIALKLRKAEEAQSVAVLAAGTPATTTPKPSRARKLKAETAQAPEKKTAAKTAAKPRKAEAEAKPKKKATAGKASAPPSRKSKAAAQAKPAETAKPRAGARAQEMAVDKPALASKKAAEKPAAAKPKRAVEEKAKTRAQTAAKAKPAPADKSLAAAKKAATDAKTASREKPAATKQKPATETKPAAAKQKPKGSSEPAAKEKPAPASKPAAATKKPAAPLKKKPADSSASTKKGVVRSVRKP